MSDIENDKSREWLLNYAKGSQSSGAYEKVLENAKEGSNSLIVDWKIIPIAPRFRASLFGDTYKVWRCRCFSVHVYIKRGSIMPKINIYRRRNKTHEKEK